MSWHWSPSCTKHVQRKCYPGTYRSLTCTFFALCIHILYVTSLNYVNILYTYIHQNRVDIICLFKSNQIKFYYHMISVKDSGYVHY